MYLAQAGIAAQINQHVPSCQGKGRAQVTHKLHSELQTKGQERVDKALQLGMLEQL